MSVLLFGLNWPIMKVGLGFIPPFWMVSLRFISSAPVILGVGVLQFFGMMGLGTLGLQFVPAGRASIVIYVTPLWLVVVDWLLSGQRPPASRFALSLLSALGCVVIVVASGKPGCGSFLRQFCLQRCCDHWLRRQHDPLMRKSVR